MKPSINHILHNNKVLPTEAQLYFKISLIYEAMRQIGTKERSDHERLLRHV